MNNKINRSPAPNFSRVSLGFTLIEAMIVVVIISVLAAISFPTYSEYVRKSNRTYAKATLMEIAQAQEKFYAVNMSYAKNLSDLSVGVTESGGVYKTDGDEYTIGLAATANDNGGVCNPTGSPPCLSFTATATIIASGPQKKDTDCSTFEVNQIGGRTAKNSSGQSVDSCWGR